MRHYRTLLRCVQNVTEKWKNCIGRPAGVTEGWLPQLISKGDNMDEEEEMYEETMNRDHKNLNAALDDLIDSVSKFKAANRIDELTAEDYAEFMVDLDYARFMLGGIMYLHGIPLCGHFHDAEEENDD